MDKKTARQKEIKDTALPYIKDKLFDLYTFRSENPKVYNRINYNFGSVEGFVTNIEADMGFKLEVKNQVTNPSDLMAHTLRNHLAYEHLKELLKEHSLQDVADYFGTTRQAVNQLWHSLKKVFEE